MANLDIRAVLTAEDKASATIKAVGTSVDVLKQRLMDAANATKFSSGAYNKLVSSLTAAEKASLSLGSSMDKASKGTSNSVKDIAKGFIVGQLAIDAFKSTMRGLGSVLQTGIKFEQFKVGFQTMMGSVQQGNLMLEKLYKFAETTPMELTAVIDGAKRLMAMGVQATDVETRLRTLGDIASVVGTDKLPQLILAFGQVNTATRLYGQELRQFTEAGVPLLEELSKITGVSTMKIKEDMGKGIVVPAALVNQALENMTKEGGIAFQGLEKQSKTLGGSITRLKNQWTLLSAKVGEFASTALVPIINRVVDFIKNNGQMIISITVAAIAVITFGAAIYGLIKLIGAVKIAIMILGASLSWVMIPLILIASLMGVVVYKSMQKMQDKIKTSTDGILKNLKNIGSSAKDELGDKAGKAAADLAEKLRDIDDQILKSNKAFTENLAEMVKSSQDKIKDLTQTLAEETASYNQENAQQLADFTKTQDDLASAHQKKVKKIQEQIDDEVGYGWLANQTKLADLRQQLLEENTDYDSQFAENKLKYEQDTSAAKTEHDKKMSDTQTKLDSEKALLDKHSADVLSIKDFQYRDEIQKLKDSHVEELAEFDRQKVKAVEASREQGKQMMNASLKAAATEAKEYNALFDQVGADLGESLGTTFKETFYKILSDMWNGIKTFFDKNSAVMKGLMTVGGAVSPAFGAFTSLIKGVAGFFKAEGGSVSGGTPYMVGEKGPEMFIPSSSGTIIPNNKLQSTGSTMTINIYGNVNNPQGFSPEEIGQIINRQIALSQQGAF